MDQLDWDRLEGRTAPEMVRHLGIDLCRGSRVRLWPKSGGDVFDLALAGKVATIEAIEQDYEGRIHLAVVIDDDPGRDFGLLRQGGHRFFFGLAEVEPLELLDNRATRQVLP